MPSNVVYKPVGKIKPIYAGGTITPPKFMPSYYEWLFNNSEQKTFKSLTYGGTTNLYTVPANHSFFVTSIFISVVNRTLNSQSSGGVFIIGTEEIEWTLPVVNPAGASTYAHRTALINFTTAIELKSGLIIQASSGTNVTLSTTIVGFLVSNNTAL